MLADMAMEVETARALIYKVTEMYEQQFQPISAYAAMSKCFPSDVAMKVTTNAVQLMGSYGYMKKYPVERMDERCQDIPDLQRGIIKSNGC